MNRERIVTTDTGAASGQLPTDLAGWFGRCMQVEVGISRQQIRNIHRGIKCCCAGNVVSNESASAGYLRKRETARAEESHNHRAIHYVVPF